MNDTYKLYRTDAPQTSIDAAHSIDVTSLELLVLNAIKDAGSEGITAKEVLMQYPELPYSSITARPKALEAKGLIYYGGDVRERSRVMRHSDFNRQ